MNMRRITSEEINSILPKLSALLQDAVNSGASAGFCWPLKRAMKLSAVCNWIRPPSLFIFDVRIYPA
jgi:hypothetical protein